MRVLPILLCLVVACDDDPGPATTGDARVDAQAEDVGPAPPDGARPDGARPDGARPDAARPDAARPDAGLDAADPDAAHDAPDASLDAQLDSAVDMARPLVDEVLTLEAENLNDFDGVYDFRLVDPGQTVRLPVVLTPALAALPQVALVVDAQVWRFEDGEVEVDFGAGPQPALLPGDGRGGPVTLRHRSAGEVAGPEGDFPIFLIPSEGLRSITLTAGGGVLGFAGARLMDPRRALPDPLVGRDSVGLAVEIVLEPCGADCDDGAAISAAIAASDPDQPLRVGLVSGRFTLRTPIVIRRSFTRLEGRGPDTVLFWDPEAEAPRGAVLVTGPGRAGPAIPIDASEAGRRRFPVDPAWAGAAYARFASDDFGEIPPTCINGRDQEQRQRHLGQLVRVLAAEGGEVVVDRPLNLAVPPASNARLEPVGLIHHVGIHDLRLEANCPEALANPRFARPECTNPFVQGDAAVLFEWVDRSQVWFVRAHAFGKFSVELSNTLDTDVYRYRMDHPSDYGEGGAGYGVHLITASRTVVRDIEVEHARHGVVIDFGSSDSQVLDSRFRDMPQALIDVHGEASRDSLIRGNTLEDAQLGVIVGGGGGVAHCNDGPRHHILRNRLAGITNSGITLFFESRQVFVRHNLIQGNLFGITVAFDSGEILAERNIFTGARIPVQLAGGGPVQVQGNVFADVCSPDLAVMTLGGGEVTVADDNVYCPDP